MTPRRFHALAAAMVLAAWCGGCGGGHHEAPYRGALEVPADAMATSATDIFPASPPPFSEGIFPCSRCHGTPEPVVTDAPSFPHASHLAKGLECADCHEDDAAPEPADPEMCDDCHEPDARGSERADAYFANLGSTFPEHWAAKIKSPAHDVHAAADVPCASCHGAATDAVPIQPGSAVLMKTCTSCHVERGAPNECTTCHDEGTPAPHANIELHHAEAQRGCLDCHDAVDRDVLHLANGTPVPFAESYRLCGQCHGPRLRDWKLGIHGKRTGEWNGRKEYLLCAHCHNPHSPRFPKMKPLPPPMRPEDVR